jgi:hypothetical protein
MANHGYLQDADVCARRVPVVHGDHGVAKANTHAVGPTAPTSPPSFPMKLTASFPETSGILRHLRHERHSRMPWGATSCKTMQAGTGPHDARG